MKGSLTISDEFGRDDPRDWPAIEHDFMHSGMSLKRIAGKHGISAWCLTEHAKKRGWVRIVPTIPLPRGRPPNPPGAPKPAAAARRNRKLVKRLLAALDKGLAQLEARMTETGAVSAADVERNARTLSKFAQLCREVEALDRAAPAPGNGESEATEATDDADAFRRALVLRLEQIARLKDSD